MKNMMIELDSIQVIFNPATPLQSTGLDGLTFYVPKGQFVTVIGSNGAGKSTLLNIVSGAIFPEWGRVKLEGQVVTYWPVTQRSPMVARVFQNPLVGSCADLTVEENMALAYRRGQKRGFRYAVTPQLREKFRGKLARLGLGLENRLGDRMGRLSGGQRQAICLLMATLAKQKILLLDEHTAALDPKTANFVLDLTRKLVDENNLTAVMVTHSMRQALEVGDRTVMMHQGQIAYDVSGEERARLSVPDLLEQFEQWDEAIS